jgi:hypothetical protein
MTSYDAEDLGDEPRLIQWVALGLLILLVVVALLGFRSAKSTAEAQDKADQLIAALKDAGARTPSQDQVVRVLGEDGGATCDDPGSALRRSTLHSLLVNGAAGPGMRPLIADNRVVKGQLLVIQIYCPDELEKFKDVVNDLDFDDVVKG